MSWTWITIFLSTLLIHAQLDGIEGKTGFKTGNQDWGHVEVRPGAHMFWWLYYANPPSKSPFFNPFRKPLLIWLQGGPGAPSSAYGNFEEIGPLDVNLEKRNYSWVNDYNVLFIDSPVGTGFSYVDDDSKLPTDNQNISYDLIRFIKVFLEKIPSFQEVPTYILSESYGGKMATHFALYWSMVQKKGMIKSNLKGVGLGDSFISPVDIVVSYAPHLYFMGMVGYDCYGSIKDSANTVKNDIDSEKWTQAYKKFLNTIQVIRKCTNGIDFYNILEKTTPLRLSRSQYRSDSREQLKQSDFDQKLTTLMNGEVKKALGLNQPFYIRNNKIKTQLAKDYMKPVTDIVERILNETNLKVFVYNGQLDVVVPTVSTYMWVQKLNWSGAKAWKNSERSSLVIDNSIEGYVQGYKNFKMFWINRAGHMTPKDNYYAMNAILYLLTSVPKHNFWNSNH
uniref:Carboxypeptidase n=1 Tax=Cotesia congregata TaxID=51543 RepID=B9W4M6_COTCN|nr:hypothetical protein [Cotesia congregata]